MYEKELALRFSSFALKNGSWNTYYTPEGLLALCEYTPTIKDFDAQKDKVALNTAIKKLATKQGIKIQQNRLLMTATKT